MFDEARAFVSNLDNVELDQWYVWKEDWPDWKNVSDVEGLTEMIFRVLHVSPPPPPRLTNETSMKMQKTGEFAKFTSSVADIDPGTKSVAPLPIEANSTVTEITQTKSFAANTAGEFIVRSKKRYNKRFLISVSIDGNTFKSYTRDISVGGINLEERLPDWVRGQFKVRIAKPHSKQAVELSCVVIENQPLDERHRILILPLQSDSDEKSLETWIAA